MRLHFFNSAVIANSKLETLFMGGDQYITIFIRLNGADGSKILINTDFE